MSTPLWVLMLYVLWTLAVLVLGVGGARLYRLRHGEALTDFPGGVAEGPPFYCRAMRAHLNCIENLPLYAAVALTAAVASVTSPVLNNLACAVLAGRIAQSCVHLAVPQTNKVIALRTALFAVQVIAIAWMAVVILRDAVPGLSP
jgi:uncharacterized MAPEG superfamily protein